MHCLLTGSPICSQQHFFFHSGKWNNNMHLTIEGILNSIKTANILFLFLCGYVYLKPKFAFTLNYHFLKFINIYAFSLNYSQPSLNSSVPYIDSHIRILGILILDCNKVCLFLPVCLLLLLIKAIIKLAEL